MAARRGRRLLGGGGDSFSCGLFIAFFKARALDEFECVALDGAEVVVEIDHGGVERQVTEERLHVAEVAGGFEHGDGGGAAQIVRDDAAVEVEALAESREGAAHDERPAGSLVGFASVSLACPELRDERLAAFEVARLDHAAHLFSDREGEGRSAFGGEVECARLAVVVLRRDEGSGSATNGEVAAEQRVHLQVRRRCREDAIDFFAGGRVVARADTGVTADVAVEFRRAVVFPEPTEDATERTSARGFRAARESALKEATVEVLDVRGAEFERAKRSACSDEETRGLKEMRAAR